MRFIKLTLATLFLTLFASIASSVAQTPDTVTKPSVITGEVASVDASKIVLSTKDGAVDVLLSDKTAFKRVPPENPSLAAAVAATLADIGEGDKLAVTGILSADRKTLPAKSVYLMTKGDIAQRNTKETEAWRTRGITGKVTSVDPVARKIGIEVRSMMGSSTVTLSPKDDAKFLRYAPDSVKFSEAKASSIVEVQRGDMLRALGDKSADGTAFTAEEIVTGAFQTVAGTVKSIDVGKNEVLITNLQTKKEMTVAIGPSSLLKKFPEEMATRMASFQGGGVRPVGQGQGQGATPPPQGNPAGGQGQAPGGAARPGFGGGRGGNIDEMLDRFPTITAADLKVGDMIAVSSTKSENIDRITAIKLLAGVEPFVRMAQMSAQRGPGGQQRSLDLNIPGLEGFGNP